MKKKKKCGAEEFDNFYSAIYSSRWERIKESFLKDPEYYTIKDRLKIPYHIDKASLLPVIALDVRPGMNILDMCAAPGGKTLLITLASGVNGSVTANDISPARRNRLKKVIAGHLPDKLAGTVKITGYDASKWGIYEKNAYDRVLLDAPCSSERHVFNSEVHLDKWSEARTRQLSKRQFSMLASAFDAAGPGGIIVYSTCSISPLENDLIIEKLFTKRKNMFMIKEIDTGDFSGIEKTEYGYRKMPDIDGSSGPIFFAVIQKGD